MSVLVLPLCLCLMVVVALVWSGPRLMPQMCCDQSTHHFIIISSWSYHHSSQLISQPRSQTSAPETSLGMYIVHCAPQRLQTLFKTFRNDSCLFSVFLSFEMVFNLLKAKLELFWWIKQAAWLAVAAGAFYHISSHDNTVSLVKCGNQRQAPDI